MFDGSKIMYGLDDLTIVPALKTKTIHRGDASVVRSNGKLPIFVAPMPSIINDKNYTTFEEAGFNTIIPRTVDISIRLALMYKTFVAVGLNEFKTFFVDEKTSIANNDKEFYICIDIANGHMEYMENLIIEAKLKYRNNLILMAGSIANAALYPNFARIGVNYIRVGIGGGSICTTSVLSGVHATLPYILNGIQLYKDEVKNMYKEIHSQARIEDNDNIEDNEVLEHIRELARNRRRGKAEEKKTYFPEELYTIPKVVVDGGINTYAKINKLLALGADYVMLGGMLAKTDEACGETKYINGIKHRVYYGMSTVKAQLEYGTKQEDIRLEEGIEKLIPIEYSLEQFVNNYSFYLREAMSLTNCDSLDKFNPANVNLCLISNNAFSEFNK